MTLSITAENLQAFFQSSPVPMVVLKADDKYTIVSMTDEYLRITSRRRDELTGRGMFEAFPGNPNASFEDGGVEELLASFDHVLTHRTPHTMPLVKYDIQGPNGTFVERYWSATHSPIFDKSGNIEFILQHTEDVTSIVQQNLQDEEKLDAHSALQMKTQIMEAELVRRIQELETAHRKLGESESKYRQVAAEAVIAQNRYAAATEASGQIMYDWDPELNEVFFAGNVEQILGYTVAEICGPLDRWLSIIHPDDVAAFSREIEKVKIERRPFRLTFRVLRKDGQILHCEDHGNFFADPDGNIVSMVGFVRDVTKRFQIENDLQESQRLLSLAQRAGRVGAFEWRVQDGTILWTPELEHLYGLEPGAFEGIYEGWEKRILPEDAVRISSEIMHCIEHQVDNYRYEFQAMLPDGATRWLAGQSSFIYDTDGQVLRMVGVNYDIHDRKVTEQALRHSEHALQLAVEIAELGMFEIDVKSGHVIVNDVGRSIYGWEVGVELTFELVSSHFHPDDRDWVLAQVGEAFSPESPGEFALEQRILTVQGEQRWIRVRGQAVFEYVHGEKTAVRCVGTYLDVTREKEFEKVLLESEEKFRTMADNISHLAWMADAEGNLIWYNRRWLDYTGTTMEEMLRRPELIRADVAGKVRSKFRQHIDAGTPWEDTFPLRGANGDYRWFLSRATPIRDSDGKISRWFGTNTDVTEQRDSELALREREERLAELNIELSAARDEALAASAAKSTFLAIMSHELRTPLNAVIGYAEMLRDDALVGTVEPDVIAEDLDRIASSGQHLLVLISDILDFSKIEAGRMELADELVDLHQLITEAANSILPQSTARGNRLAVCSAGEPQFIKGDYTRLKQVLINLLSNAAKFTENGTIHLTYGSTAQVDGEAPTLWFEVADTGIGIAPENMPLLYERFRQLDSSHTRTRGGTGLGLAITKRLVELMNGTIEVSSELGEGTTFRVTLPLNPALHT